MKNSFGSPKPDQPAKDGNDGLKDPSKRWFVLGGAAVAAAAALDATPALAGGFKDDATADHIKFLGLSGHVARLKSLGISFYEPSDEDKANMKRVLAGKDLPFIVFECDSGSLVSMTGAGFEKPTNDHFQSLNLHPDTKVIDISYTPIDQALLKDGLARRAGRWDHQMPQFVDGWMVTITTGSTQKSDTLTILVPKR